MDRRHLRAQLGRPPENRLGLRVLFALVVHEADGVEDRGRIGRELLGTQRERQCLLQILRPRGIDPGKVVQDRGIFRTQALRFPVRHDGSIALALPLVHGPTQEVCRTQVGLQTDRGVQRVCSLLEVAALQL